MLFTMLGLAARAIAAPARTTVYTSSRRSLLGGRRETATRVVGRRAAVVAVHR